jgi:hypothetical protein
VPNEGKVLQPHPYTWRFVRVVMVMMVMVTMVVMIMM